MKVLLGEHVALQAAKMINGGVINNNKKREEQLTKILRLVDNFVARNPKYK